MWTCLCSHSVEREGEGKGEGEREGEGEGEGEREVEVEVERGGKGEGERKSREGERLCVWCMALQSVSTDPGICSTTHRASSSMERLICTLFKSSTIYWLLYVPENSADNV